MNSENQKKLCKPKITLKKLLILTSSVTGSFPIHSFASLVCILIGTRSFTVGVKICAITYKIVLLAKTKLNTIEVLISMASIHISVLMNLFL